MPILRVALDVPLADSFDFLPPPESPAPPVGALVVVPFGRTRKVGVVVATAAQSELPEDRLRAVERVVDDVPPLGDEALELYSFCAAYYHRGIGEVIGTALPPRLRQTQRRALAAPVPSGAAPAFQGGIALSEAQREAVRIVREGHDRFHPVLLQGVTGSGKSEAYLHLLADTVGRGRQALLMVPEIGLTPQFEAQVRERFPGARVVSAHSHLAQGERARGWLEARTGAAHIVLGTRLAILMPFEDLGLIVVDEEHDASYKQQDGLRYSARDVAVRRAQRLGIPVVLGSATPALETLHNAAQGRYAWARLPERAVPGAVLPRVRTIDTRADRPVEGLSDALLRALRERIARGEQSLLFLNRRGFAPVLHCPDCAWHSVCTRCSANLVLHRREARLRCHHCGHEERMPPRCPGCGGATLLPIGQGTQRIEEAVAAALPEARIVRVDRDSTARKGSLQTVLERVRQGEIDVLVGTQMLSKGHDYPRLTLVGVLGSDAALFSADFRAAERLFAQLMQVSGRAGRGTTAGEVLIQTDFPQHPLYAAVARHDFDAFAADALAERQLTQFPPFAHLALLRAEAKRGGEALRFLAQARELAKGIRAEVEVFDPVPALLERKAGFERAQLLVRAATRAALQPFLAEWMAALAGVGERRVRWSLDVDPQEV